MAMLATDGQKDRRTAMPNTLTTEQGQTANDVAY